MGPRVPAPHFYSREAKTKQVSGLTEKVVGGVCAREKSWGTFAVHARAWEASVRDTLERAFQGGEAPPPPPGPTTPIFPWTFW